MVRRLIAASFVAATLTVLTVAQASAQVSPPTSDTTPTSQVAGSGLENGLPTTGTEVLPTVLAGAALAGTGAGLVVVARRRRTLFAARHLAR
jgi:LPXTG-motif cell wall-anchored protein